MYLAETSNNGCDDSVYRLERGTYEVRDPLVPCRGNTYRFTGYSRIIP